MQRTAAIAIVTFLSLKVFAAADAQGPMAPVQQLFDAMASHNSEAARALFLPEAHLFSIRADAMAAATPYSQFVERIGASKDKWLERIWNPQILEQGSVAVVWAEYDFHRNCEFSHCGIDSFSLLKTASGWKIASISDTRQTKGCPPSPLGPPAK